MRKQRTFTSPKTQLAIRSAPSTGHRASSRHGLLASQVDQAIVLIVLVMSRCSVQRQPGRTLKFRFRISTSTAELLIYTHLVFLSLSSFSVLELPSEADNLGMGTEDGKESEESLV
ncbi:hypothetical protein RvY_14816-2 [Ramazzottius varieornatus]|uniref:Uncharacterized protein n=1 Tax=Ramazzottius varieornatus TaxID=947166 RepID=A0A1D1VXK4_RAMVA|nr:hypothetical protein RvY_14816-2 [Ramazzottius varieornatus]